MNETLMRIIVQSICFLELSADEIIDPDAAVSELESISSELQSLSEAEKRTFIKFTQGYSSSTMQAGKDARAEFIKSIPDALGLLD